MAAKGFEAVKAYQELTSYLVEVEGISRKRGGGGGGIMSMKRWQQFLVPGSPDFLLWKCRENP